MGGAATLNGGLFQNNTSTTNHGGGLWVNSTLDLTGTQFLSNIAGGSGGGAYATGAATLNGALFQNNQCTAGGCLSDGWYANSNLSLTQVVTTGDDIQNQGLTTQAANSVIVFNGTASQAINGSGSTTFNAMWVNNTGGGVYLGQDITVTDRLTLTTDLTTTASYRLNLTLNATSAGAGDVWGRTYRNHTFSTSVTYPFGNPNVSVNFASGTPPTEMTIDLTRTVPITAGFSNGVIRFYRITQVGASGFTATLRLHYGDGELNGSTEGSLKLWRWVGSTWTPFTASAFDSTDNWAESDSITGFSPWMLSEPAPTGPTAITLQTFSAQSDSRSASLMWLLLGAIGSVIGLGVVWKKRHASSARHAPRSV